MDNGRQNYRSLKLAAALTFIGLLQVIALSPLWQSTAWMGFYLAWLSTQWYWTVDQPIFTAMHGLLTFVSGGIFLVYLRATVKHEVKAEEHPERIKLRAEQQEARDKAREAAKDQGMVAQIRAAAMFNPKCVFGCFARLDSGP